MAGNGSSWSSRWGADGVSGLLGTCSHALMPHCATTASPLPQGKPLSRDAASQLLQQWAGVGAGATAAGSCRSSDNGSTCALGGGDKPAGGAASGGCSSASLADAESASAGRSSLDSEGGSLPRRICHALSCGLYAGGTVQ